MSTASACHTVLFASLNSGLGNRLRALVGYEALSRVRNSRFCLYWAPEIACDAPFTDLFESSGATLVTADEALALQASGAALICSANAWFHEIWRKYAPDIPWMVFVREVHASLDRLRPIAPIREAAASFSRAHRLSDALGVHIRQTDNELYVWKWKSPSNSSKSPPNSSFDAGRISRLEGFVDLIDAHIDRMPVFLTTDNPGIDRMCRARFGDRLITYPKHYTTEWPPDPADKEPWRKPLRTTAVSEALLEILLLASCRRIVGTYYSSFSKLAAIWGRVDYLEMTGCVPAPREMIATTVAEFRAIDAELESLRSIGR